MDQGEGATILGNWDLAEVSQKSWCLIQDLCVRRSHPVWIGKSCQSWMWERFRSVKLSGSLCTLIVYPPATLGGTRESSITFPDLVKEAESQVPLQTCSIRICLNNISRWCIHILNFEECCFWMSVQFQCLVYGVSCGTRRQYIPCVGLTSVFIPRALMTCDKILAQLSKQVCTPLSKPSARDKFGDL